MLDTRVRYVLTSHGVTIACGISGNGPRLLQLWARPAPACGRVQMKGGVEEK